MSALRDVQNAGLRVVAVRTEDLVLLREIAHRTGRTYESVRLLANGSRGPGGFPPPLSQDTWVVYSWSQVAPWFARHHPTVDIDRALHDLEYDRVLAAADHLVRARVLMAGDAAAAVTLAQLLAA